MERNLQPPGSRRPFAARLLLAAVPLASLLSFAIQPMMGKRILPIYGGSAGTWLGAMVFFQLALLLGYGWAVWLLRRPPAFQRGATLALAVLALGSFRLPGAAAGSAVGVGRVLLTLAMACLPAMMMLFSVSPLVHGWLRKRGEGVPYYVYAISNLGSLAGLVIYPFAIEPRLTLTQQRWIVEVGMVGVAALLVTAVWQLRPAAEKVADPVCPAEPVRHWEVARWVLLSAVTCIAMLGGTQLIAAEIGSTPIAWVGPFGVYLLSFALTFSGRWRPWMTSVAMGAFTLSFFVFIMRRGMLQEPLHGSLLWVLLAAVAAASFVGNSSLYRLRPAWDFDRYYLALAAGGVLGGLLVSLVLPRLISQPLEFHLAGGLLLLVGIITEIAQRHWGARILALLLVLVPLIGICWQQSLYEDSLGRGTHYRNEYGYMVVRKTADRTELLNETTLHGTQVRVNAISARRPTLYYSESTGAGRILLQLRALRSSLRVGVIGLGAGTLAAYARPADSYTFWDIDPKAITIARTQFSYLSDSAGTIVVEQADGRRGLAASTEDFDLIIVDAFSGDGVPAHLVTAEALQIYLRRLQARKGYLLVHVSSRYAEAYPVLSATARSVGQASLAVVTEMNKPGVNLDWDPCDSEYVIIVPDSDLKLMRAWFPESEENGRVHHQINFNPAMEPDPRLVWTDERSAAIQTLNLRRLLWSGAAASAP